MFYEQKCKTIWKFKNFSQNVCFIKTYLRGRSYFYGVGLGFWERETEREQERERETERETEREIESKREREKWEGGKNILSYLWEREFMKE